MWVGITRSLIAAHNALDASRSVKIHPGIVAYTVKLELTIKNCYVACETLTLHQASDPIDDDDDRSHDGHGYCCIQI